MSYGTGKYTYELADWSAKFPEGWQPVEVNGICIDAQDRLFAFNTGAYPVRSTSHTVTAARLAPMETSITLMTATIP
jgi:hypothetical protein